MHEMGIVLHLAKTLDETAAEEHLARIGSVTLQVGEVSGILTDYFQECWDYFKVRHPVLVRQLQTYLRDREVRTRMPLLPQWGNLAAPRKRVHHQADRGRGSVGRGGIRLRFDAGA